MKELAEIEQIFLSEAENKLKNLLGSLYDDHKNDLAQYAKDLARLEYKIFTGNNSTSVQIAIMHLKNITIPCLVQRIKGRVSSEVLGFFETMLNMMLSLAVAWGSKYLQDKLVKGILA